MLLDDASLAEIRSADRLQLKMIYWKLEAPQIRDVSGEYDAELLDQGDRVESFLTQRVFRSKGEWIGKAFRPISDSTGEGYNAFGSVENRQPLLPMDTYLDHSQIVPGYSFILDYRKKNRGMIRWLRGEVRQLTPSVLLGMGLFGPRGRHYRKLRRVIPFMMIHSDRAYLSE